MGLFYAWDGIVSCEDGSARVNLLLNRASQWLDVHSYLPYEGKVVIKNKTANEVFVRVPLWVDRKAVRCTRGRMRLPQLWFGNYLRVRDLKPDDVLTVKFPVVETTEEWSADEPTETRFEVGERRVHTCRFRGNTLVEMSPPIAPGSPLYGGRPARFSLDRAPMRKRTRYVSPVAITW